MRHVAFLVVVAAMMASVAEAKCAWSGGTQNEKNYARALCQAFDDDAPGHFLKVGVSDELLMITTSSEYKASAKKALDAFRDGVWVFWDSFKKWTGRSNVSVIIFHDGEPYAWGTGGDTFEFETDF